MEENLFNPPQTAPNADPLANAAQQAAAHVDALQQQLADARKISRLFDDLVSYRDRGFPAHIKALCEKESSILKSLRQQGHPSIDLIERLYRDAKAKAERIPASLPGDLEDLSKHNNLELDFSRSRHPKYFFGTKGMLEIEINDKRIEAKIGTREGNLTRLPADGPAIISALAVEQKRLFERDYKTSDFLNDLRSAYSIAVKAKNAVDGDPVPLREVFELMTQKIKSLKSYKSDEFLVDLSRLVMEGPAETEGYRFELQQTKDTKEGMLLLGEAGRGMVNLLIFKKPNTEP